MGFNRIHALGLINLKYKTGSNSDEIQHSGKWKLEIMWLLNERVYRFGELRKAIPGITQHMLTAQLRELEADGLISRTIFAEVPLRVEYEMTQKARGLGPTMEALAAWWSEYGTTVPVRPSTRGRKPS
ncbi:winged helix-turn-helix transcriptional regulator [Ochrobactrum sp. MYb379]|uniref:winged helix-turn-helix transcriptional regulator n=1 Tax=Ochrobactrum sp. MYb379 TaxID=2745275 RepID=UPI0030AD4B97